MSLRTLRKLQSLDDRRERYYLVGMQGEASSDEESILRTVVTNSDVWWTKKLENSDKEVTYALLDSKNEVLKCMSDDEVEDLFYTYTSFAMFGREKRSQFSYWFAHWCAFQMTALNLGVWKPKYLLHDIEKPWKLVLFKDYKKVQSDHRTRNNHHTEYGVEHGWDKMDWEAAVIDWECSRFTKRQAQMNARETLEWLLGRDKWKPYKKEIREGIEPVLHRLGL